MDILELKEQKEALELKMVNLMDTAETETRDLSEDEAKDFDSWQSELTKVDARIARAEKAQEIRAHQVRVAKDKKVETPEKKARRNYSITRAIKQFSTNGGKLEGLEAEMDQEARAANPLITGIGVPNFVGDTDHRSLTAGTAASAGNAIETDLMPGVIKSLQPNPKVFQLGAEVKRGLVGDYELLRNTVAAQASWKGEVAAVDETTPEYDKLALTPNKMGAFVTFSKQLMFQNTRVADSDLTTLIREAQARLLDATAINGDSSGTDPFDGILNTSNIGNVALGPNGAAPTFPAVVNLETEIRQDNAEAENMKYFTTPAMIGWFKSHYKDAGSGMPFLSGGQMNGYGVVNSTLVPSALTKGTNSDCHAVIFGAWKNMVFGNWANGYDIVVDPYTGAKQSTIDIVVNSWWDMVIKHPEAFAAILDARNVEPA